MGNYRTSPDKIVSCCYCGARSILSGKEKAKRLVCHGCGAPIRRIEALETPGRKIPARPARKPAIPHAAERRGQHLDKDRPARRRKGKRRGLWYQVRKAFDDFDDLDDLFDLFD